MIQIRSHLFLGTQREARNESELLRNGISHLLCVTTSFRHPRDESFRYLHRPLADEGTSTLSDVLDECCSFIETAKLEAGRTLLFCRQAQNRSPSITIAYLMRHEDMPLRKAYLEVANARPEISPHESYFAQLQELDRELFGAVSFSEEDRGGSVQALIREMWKDSES